MLSMFIFAAATTAQPTIVIPSTKVPPGSALAGLLCRDKGVQTVGGQPGAPVRAQKLNELPNADEYLTVMRLDENGCQKPAIVNYDIGGALKKQR